MPVNASGIVAIVFSLTFIVLLLLRSGNYIPMPQLLYEEEFRKFLEKTLFVRPRTKEFLIGNNSSAVPKEQGIEGGISEFGVEIKKTLPKIRIMPKKCIEAYFNLYLTPSSVNNAIIVPASSCHALVGSRKKVASG